MNHFQRCKGKKEKIKTFADIKLWNVSRFYHRFDSPKVKPDLPQALSIYLRIRILGIRKYWENLNNWWRKSLVLNSLLELSYKNNHQIFDVLFNFAWFVDIISYILSAIVETKKGWSHLIALIFALTLCHVIII